MALFSKKQPTNDTFVVPLPETPAEVRRRRIISAILIVILVAILIWAIIAIYSQSKDNRSADELNGDSTISQPATTDNTGADSEQNGSGSAADDSNDDNDSNTNTNNNSDNTSQNQSSGNDTSNTGASNSTGQGTDTTSLPATGDMLAN